VEGSDLIDERVTHAALAEHCGLGSIKTVQRALAKYRKHGWLILDQEAEGRRSSYYRIPYEELMDVVKVKLNHWDAQGRNPWREGWWDR
jgi:transposase